MKKGIFFRIISGVAAIAFLGLPGVAFVDISFTLEDLGAGRWNAVYEINNMGLIAPIQQFSIWFDNDYYQNLNITTPSPLNINWDERFFAALSIPPLQPSDGFYDAMALGEGVVPGQSIRGFSVSFDWCGDGMPIGGQPFEINDPHFVQSPLYEGITFYVPEPGTLLLLITGSVFAVNNHYRRRRR